MSIFIPVDVGLRTRTGNLLPRNGRKREGEFSVVLGDRGKENRSLAQKGKRSGKMGSAAPRRRLRKRFRAALFSAKLQKFTENAEFNDSRKLFEWRTIAKNREADFLQKRVYAIYKSKYCARFPPFPTFARIIII